MTPRLKTHLLTATMIASGLALALPAWAQAPAAAPAEPAKAEEEIVVTARRVGENVQKVPASVSAFSEKTLIRLGANDVTGIQGAVPNLNLVQGRGSSDATNIYIRGVGQPDALQTFDPAVGLYVDDVYFSRIRGTQLDLLDIERVEVLRGPQGTLYGKNTIGGALKIVTRRPGDAFRASVSLTAGSYAQFEAKGSISGPVADGVSVGLSLLRATRDGYVKDPVLNQKYNDKDVMAGRLHVAIGGDGPHRFDIIADVSKQDAALTVGQPLNTLTTLIGGLPIITLPAVTPEYNFETRVTPGLPNSTKLQHWGISGTGSFALNDALTLKTITAFRKLNTRDYIDIDATQFQVGDVFVGVNQDQLSQEFQLIYKSGGWNVVSGLYYMEENITSHQEAYANNLVGPLLGNPTFTRTIDDDLKTTSKAAYLNVTYAVSEALRLSAGVRYTEEEKTYSRTTSTFSSLALLRANPAFAFSGLNKTWSDVSPSFSIDYQISDDVMVYGRIAKGFKSGGFNGRANNPGEQAPYAPETMTSYEIGVKASFWDGKARANLALFQNDYKDFQARVRDTVLDPGTGLPTPQLTVINAGKLEIRGAELELFATPVEGLQLDAQIGLLDAQYGEFKDVRFAAFGGSRAYQTPAFSPKWTARLGASYAFDLGESGSITLGASARYRSRMALAVDNTLTNSAAEIPGLFQEAYWLYDARIVWEDAEGRFSAGVYAKNLSDEIYKTDGQEFSSVGNIRTVYFGAPRTFSFTVTAKY